VHTIREDLTDEECRRLLGATSRGHLAFTRDALPAIAPVRYAVDGDRLVIPARPDSDHLAPAGGAVVVLGIDDAEGDAAWAVTVVGPARTVADQDVRYVVLTIGVLRGWRTLPVPPPA
jgi:nitroimidazol reductase NimA-like FMN-containing flavoprotein (pyridoxamine 5'-phosphate oxidase superfamily)